MLLWCVSTLLTLAYNFPDTELIDLEIDAAGIVWLLPVSTPSVIRLDSIGGQTVFDTGIAGLPSGLAVSPTGRWALSCQNPGAVSEFSRSDIILKELTQVSSGDILFSGLNIWITNTVNGNVVSSTGEIIGRNCGSRDSRLCLQRTGSGMISGSKGVFLLELGETPVRIAEKGSACFSAGGILLLLDGTLKTLDGDTLLTDLPYSRISASPGGDTVILWGNSVPLVLE